MINQSSYEDIVLAAGGRYDALVAAFCNAISSPENPMNWNWLTGYCRKETRICNKQYAVGGAIYMKNLLKVSTLNYKVLFLCRANTSLLFIYREI